MKVSANKELKQKPKKNDNMSVESDNKSFKKEAFISGHMKSIPLSKINIITEQMKKSICIIDIENLKGTGFLCLIPYPNRLTLFRVLITCNHVLNDLKIGNKIKLIFDGKQKIIIIDEFRKTYTNKEYDITIIELKENEFELNDYLKIDDLIYKEKELNKIYKDKQIYIIHYSKGKEVNYSVDKIINIENNHQIEYYCATDNGSSGAPILNLDNNQVIGIHKGYDKIKNCNVGEIIKLGIDNFNIKYKQNNENKYKEEYEKLYKENYIIAEIEIKEEDINKDIRIINSYEQCKREYKWEDDKEDNKRENEKEIKENCEIKINNKK